MKELQPLPELTGAHKHLLDCISCIEKTGEMCDGHLRYMNEILYNHLRKELSDEATRLIERLNELAEIAILDIESQAKNHLKTHNLNVIRGK